MAMAAATWVAWVAWADIDPSERFGGTENRARLEEIPAAFFVKPQCKECLTYDKDALHSIHHEKKNIIFYHFDQYLPRVKRVSQKHSVNRRGSNSKLFPIANDK
jgi:hypothetical protein